MLSVADPLALEMLGSTLIALVVEDEELPATVEGVLVPEMLSVVVDPVILDELLPGSGISVVVELVILDGLLPESVSTVLGAELAVLEDADADGLCVIVVVDVLTPSEGEVSGPEMLSVAAELALSEELMLVLGAVVTDGAALAESTVALGEAEVVVV